MISLLFERTEERCESFIVIELHGDRSEVGWSSIGQRLAVPFGLDSLHTDGIHQSVV